MSDHTDLTGAIEALIPPPPTGPVIDLPAHHARRDGAAAAAAALAEAMTVTDSTPDHLQLHDPAGDSYALRFVGTAGRRIPIFTLSPQTDPPPP